MRLYLGSYFAFFTPDRRHWVELELSKATLLTDILSELGIPPAEVHLVVVNDQVLESPDNPVTNGDVVRLFPAVGGG